MLRASVFRKPARASDMRKGAFGNRVASPFMGGEALGVDPDATEKR